MTEMPAVQRLNLQFELPLIQTEVEDLLGRVPLEQNQICLNRPVVMPSDVNPYHVGCGKMLDRQTRRWRYLEEDFSVINEDLQGSYLHHLFQRMKEETRNSVGRFRIAVLPAKRCYSLHFDADTPRFHLAVKTNSESFFLFPEDEPGQQVFQIPADGMIYSFDARRVHTALNSGATDRVHLLFSNSRLWVEPEERMRAEG